MSKVNGAALSRTPRSLRAVGALGPNLIDQEDEESALRRVLLELRADLPHVREVARESNRTRFAEALAALGELAITTEALGPLLGAACELVAETLDVDAVALLEEAPQGGGFSVRSACGCLAGAAGEPCDAGEGTQLGFALSERGSTATADARAAWMEDPFLARHQLVGAALVILPGFGAQRALLGAYALQRRAFAPDEVRFMEAAAGSVSAAVGRCRAEAERNDLHARLALADRLVSVGTLAAGVAHELNNPLSYVAANVTFVAEQATQLAAALPETARTPELAEALEQLEGAAADARDGVERMRVIVRDLATLSRGDDASTGPVEIQPVLESCINVAWNVLKHRARLARDLAPLPAVRGNLGRLGQVFLNLLVNAAQAIPPGQEDRHEIRVATRIAGPGQVAVEVSDDGSGIAPEVLPRIFDPFFTTKPPGEGTGLGLSICHGIVTGMGGRIEVESAPGRGSTFRVILPVAGPEPREEAAPATPGRSAPRSRARILVVDDEPLVGVVIQRTLGGEHDIVVTSSGREALERIGRGEAFDLVFSDLLMPEMTGMELFDQLSRSAPALARRMVFLTGGAFTEPARAFLARDGVECVEKPFDLDTIRGVIARRVAPGPV